MTKKDQKILKDAEQKQIPVFVITAKDANSLQALREYLEICVDDGCSLAHIAGIQDRIEEFEKWQAKNIDLVKQPD